MSALNDEFYLLFDSMFVQMINLEQSGRIISLITFGFSGPALATFQVRYM